MIISDLNHVEVISEETETRIVGGFTYIFSHTFSNSPKSPTTSTFAFTRTIGQPGSRGSSSSSSSSTVSYW